MKMLIASLISCLLLVSFGALAEEHGADHSAAAEHGEGHAPSGKQHRDNTALFPQPKANIAKGTAPAKPELMTPAFQSKVTAGTVALSWKASDGADAYHVQVATDPNFKWLQVDERWVKATTFEASGLEAGHHYYWRVAPWKDGNAAATNKGTFASSAFFTE